MLIVKCPDCDGVDDLPCVICKGAGAVVISDTSLQYLEIQVNHIMTRCSDPNALKEVLSMIQLTKRLYSEED